MSSTIEPIPDDGRHHSTKEIPVKKTLSLIALATAASFAGPLKVGGDVAGSMYIPSFDPDEGLTANMGFGGKIAPAVEYSVNEQFSLRTNVGYQFMTYGAEMEFSDYDMTTGEHTTSKITADITSHLLTIDLAAQYAFVPEIFGSLGVGYDINLSSKMDVSGEEDDEDKANPFVISAGLGYKISPELAVTAGYRFPLTAISDGDEMTIKVQTVNVGIRYDMGL